MKQINKPRPRPGTGYDPRPVCGADTGPEEGQARERKWERARERERANEHEEYNLAWGKESCLWHSSRSAKRQMFINECCKTSNIVEHSPRIQSCCKCKLQLPALLKDLWRYQITHFQGTTFSLLRENHFQFLYAKMHNFLFCYTICVYVCIGVCVQYRNRHTMQTLISSTNSLVTR